MTRHQKRAVEKPRCGPATDAASSPAANANDDCRPTTATTSPKAAPPRARTSNCSASVHHAREDPPRRPHRTHRHRMALVPTTTRPRRTRTATRVDPLASTDRRAPHRLRPHRPPTTRPRTRPDGPGDRRHPAVRAEPRVDGLDHYGRDGRDRDEAPGRDRSRRLVLVVGAGRACRSRPRWWARRVVGALHARRPPIVIGWAGGSTGARHVREEREYDSSQQCGKDARERTGAGREHRWLVVAGAVSVTLWRRAHDRYPLPTSC